MGGCAGAPHGCTKALEAQLLFGAVPEAEFDAFLDRSVTSRFPAGLTVVEAKGRWQAPDGRQVREDSRLVLVVVPPKPDPRPALDAVREDFKRRFHQQSVGLVLFPTCASF